MERSTPLVQPCGKHHPSFNRNLLFKNLLDIILIMNPLPCYACLFLGKVRNCKPENCEDLDRYLMVSISIPMCPSCNSQNVIKKGFTYKRRQLWRCKQCGHRFRHRSGKYLFKKRYSSEIINYAKLLASRDHPAFSLRDIAREIRVNFGVKVSHVTVSEWIEDFC